MLNRSDMRSKRMFQFSLDRLSKQGFKSLHDPGVWDRLDTTREHVQGAIMFDCLDMWEEIIYYVDTPAFYIIGYEDNDWTMLMRKLSPLGVFIKEEERLELIRNI